MDESTAALDPVLERRLIDRLFQHRAGLTTILISHRPSVIMRCDWVVYLEAGQVRYQGPPSELQNMEDLQPYLLPA